MAKLLILQGLPASGKTTLAKLKVEKSGGNWKRVNKDEIRLMVDNGKFSKKNESIVKDIFLMTIRKIMETGNNIVADNTGFNPNYISELETLARKFNYTVEIKKMKTTIKECLQMDKGRAGEVGEQVIKDMARRYLPEQYKEEFQYMPDTSKNKAVIFDLDGTLAASPHRSPYDYSCVDKDVVVPEVLKDLKRHVEEGYRILFVSGRSNECKEMTLQWIEDNILKKDSEIYPYEIQLFMRPEGDTRKDTVIKEELFDKFIANNYNVERVYDDRLSVCRMWAEKGLFTFCVNQELIDF